MTGVRIEIGALAFAGLDADAAALAGTAFTAELERLVAVRGIDRPAPPARLSRDPGPAEIGRAAAAAVHARIAR